MQKRISYLSILAIILSPALLCAQTAANAGSGDSGEVVKVVRVHGNATSIANAAGSYSGAHYVVSNELNAIVVRGRPDAVASVERTIEQLDGLNGSAVTKASGTRNVEILAYVVGGSNEALPGTEDISGEALGPVVKQLRAIFPYKHYALLNSMLLRAAQDGKANSEGVMKALSGADSARPSEYQIGFAVARLSGDNPPEIHLGGFRFFAQVPIIVSGDKTLSNATQSVQREVSVNTDVDLREGQKVVVGKANVANSDTCFFLILSARLVS